MTTVYVSGKGYWFQKIFQEDNFRGTRFWALKFYPDPESRAKVLAVGKQIREDDDGEYVTLKRTVLKPWKLKPNESAERTPPEVMDADNHPWSTDILIGNGSKVTCKLTTYTTRNGPGSVLEAIRVDELVEYQKPAEPAVQPPMGQQTPIQTQRTPF